MKKQIEALITELREPRILPGGFAYKSSDCTDIADRLTAILAADAGGWRPWSEISTDGSTWQWRHGSRWGLVSCWPRDDGSIHCDTVEAVKSGGFYLRHKLRDGLLDGAEVRPLPGPPPQEPPR